MTPAVKSIFLISLKNAVNAILTNSALMAMLHGAFNFYSRNGLWNLGKATLAVVASREAMIWAPKILAWTQTNGTAIAILSFLGVSWAASSNAQ